MGVEANKFQLISMAIERYCQGKSSTDDCRMVTDVSLWPSLGGTPGESTIAFKNGDGRRFFLDCKRDAGKYACDFRVGHKALFGGGGFLVGCSGDSNNPYIVPDYDAYEDYVEMDIPASDLPDDENAMELDVAEAELADVFAETVWQNPNFLSIPAQVADLECNAGYLYGLFGAPLPERNYIERFEVKVDDPMKPQSFKTTRVAGGKMVHMLTGEKSECEVSPAAIAQAGAGIYYGDYVIPFECSDGNSSLSGASIFFGDGFSMNLLRPFDFSGLSEDEKMLRISGVSSALISFHGGMYSISFPGLLATSKGEIGILKSYLLDQSMPYEFDLDPALFPFYQSDLPVLLMGKGSSAIAEVPNFFDSTSAEDRFAAVLNSRGFADGEQPYGLSNASVDIVRISNPVLDNYSPFATIDLGVAAVAPLKKMPLTSDGKTAAFFADGRVIIADMERAKVASVLQVPAVRIVDITDARIKGNTLYLSAMDSIRTYDITDPAKPVVEKIITAEGKVGSICVDDDEIIYAAVSDSTGEAPEFSVVAIDPAQMPK